MMGERIYTTKRLMLTLTISLICFIIWKARAPAAAVPDRTEGLRAFKERFYLDGKPLRILSGSFHYFRTRPSDWGDRLRKMKAAGLNTVTTYVPWNLHEPTKGQYVFGGDIDIVSFVKLAQNVGLHVIIRPGPYICAEWEFGGLPAWLLKDPNMKVRSSYTGYMQHLEDYFGQLLPILHPLTYKRGGPIIAFQVENEYGHYGEDSNYMNSLIGLFNKFHLDELYFTSDGIRQIDKLSLPGILRTANFKHRVNQNLEELKMLQPDMPLMVAEFWPGWFDHWNERHHGMESHVFEESVSAILQHGASINFYMFVGGTNFGFWNGANADLTGFEYFPTITSYDYDAPISEDGSLKDKFFITQRLILEHTDEIINKSVSNINVKKTSYGTFVIEQWMSYEALTNIAEHGAAHKYRDRIINDSPLSMEQLSLTNDCGQNVGFLLYRAEIQENAKLLEIKGEIRDRVQILVNNREVETVYRSNMQSNYVSLSGSSATQNGVGRLDLLVENLGRVNYLSLDTERKGLLGTVDVDGETIASWTHIPIDFSEEFVDRISRTDLWIEFRKREEFFGTGDKFLSPGIYRTRFNIKTDPTDTYLDMYGWTKGVVFINGFNIGRYWRLGPQRTLYVPKSLLKKDVNTVMIFELHEPYRSIAFTNYHLLDEIW